MLTTANIAYYDRAKWQPYNIHSAQIISALNTNLTSPVPNRGVNLKDFLDFQEKEYIQQKLFITNGKKQQAADLLGIDRATLWKKIKKYDI